MATTGVNAVAGRFLDALARRDFDTLAETFAEDGVLRGLVPSAVREASGREAIAERFRLWNEGDEWELLETDVEEVADLLRVRWKAALREPGEERAVYEQTAYLDVAEAGIARMNLVCTGSRPLAE